MRRRTCRSLPAVSWAIAGAILVVLTPTTVPASGSASKTVTAEPILLSGPTAVFEAVDTPPEPGQGVALLIGGSGVPIPPVGLAQTTFDNYANAGHFKFGGYAPERLFTPEGASPAFSGVKSLPFDTSVAQGTTILEDAITKKIEEGHPVFVESISQSATINSRVLHEIADGSFTLPNTADLPPGATPLAFLSLGNPSNPNGGFLERFNLPQDPDPTVPSVGLTFDGAAPADTGIPTASRSGLGNRRPAGPQESAR